MRCGRARKSFAGFQVSLSIVENKCEITGRARAAAQCGKCTSTNGEARPGAGINKRDDDRVRNGAAA